MEPDTAGIDSCEEIDNVHLCVALCTLLPRMRHLRIRLAHICPWCLPGSVTQDSGVDAKQTRNTSEVASLVLTEDGTTTFDKMLSCTINLIVYPRHQTVAMCSQHQDTLRRTKQRGRAGRLRAELAVAVAFHRALQHGMFPNVQSLNIFGSKVRGDGSLRPMYGDYDILELCDGHKYFEQILHFDIMAYSTHALPFFPLALNDRLYRLRLRDFEPNLLRDANNQLLVGSLSTFEAHLEGTWSTTNTGVRMPISYRQSQDPEDAEFV